MLLAKVFVWIELAAIRTEMNRPGQAIGALKQAVNKGGEPIRSLIRKDPRFAPLRNQPKFKELIPPVPAASPFALPYK